MNISLQFAAGFAFLTGAAVLAHFFYVVLRAPENMNLGLTDQKFPASWSGRAYLTLVVISWASFVFSGAYGLLKWLPSEGALTFASMVAFLSLGLLVHLEKSSHNLHGYRRAIKVQIEIRKLIEYATIVSQETIDRFQEKSKSAETVAEREAYAELVGFASNISERDKKLCEYAVHRAQYEEAKKAEELARAEKASKTQSERQELRNRLKNSISTAAHNLQVIKTIDSAIVGNEALIEHTVAMQKWRLLNNFGERLRKLGESAPIQSLLQSVAGAQQIEETNFKLELFGNERDGHYEAVSIHSGTRRPLADGLSFESSLDGLMAAFFLRAALPGRLAWGHGFYDRDQEFIFTQERAVNILENDRVLPDSEGLQEIKIPAGFRFSRAEDGTIVLRCLTYKPGKGFYDFGVSITGAKVSDVQEIKLYQWGQGILY